MESETPTTEAAWERFGEDLRRFIRRRVRDDHRADDLLQEVFVRIHRHIGSVRDAERLQAWVYRIARNTIHDHHRGGPDVESATDELPEPSPADAPPQNAEVAGWLRGLIGGLPEPYRDAVALAELEGLPHREVAARLGLSPSGAKSRVARGRSLLRASLRRCCELEFDRRGNVLGYEPKRDAACCREDAAGPGTRPCGPDHPTPTTRDRRPAPPPDRASGPPSSHGGLGDGFKPPNSQDPAPRLAGGGP